MDFGTLPPEISSALIHSGPGAGSLIDASAAWQQLGTELEESLPRYGSVLASLGEAWEGPSEAAMIQAVEPFLAWLGTTAQQCEQVGSSMQAVAAAFELARRTVVFPVEVTANRARVAQLIATNWLGTNFAAIAETDAQYEGMWVDNSAAMFRYAATSAQATKLSQFSSPPAIANPAAAAAEAGAATAAAAATPAASTPLGDFLTSILSTPLGFNPQTGWFGLLNTYANQFIAGGIPINLLSYLAQLKTAQALTSVGGDIGQGLSEGEAALGGVEASLADAIRAGGAAPTAAVGVGVSIGKLTAPPAMVGLLSASKSTVQLAAAVSPLAADESGFPFMPPPMMPPVTPRDKRKREGRDYDDLEIGLEIKGTFMTRPPSAG
jgi:PPE-repeat protein